MNLDKRPSLTGKQRKLLNAVTKERPTLSRETAVSRPPWLQIASGTALLASSVAFALLLIRPNWLALITLGFAAGMASRRLFDREQRDSAPIILLLLAMVLGGFHRYQEHSFSRVTVRTFESKVLLDPEDKAIGQFESPGFQLEVDGTWCSGDGAQISALAMAELIRSRGQRKQALVRALDHVRMQSAGNTTQRYCAAMDFLETFIMWDSCPALISFLGDKVKFSTLLQVAKDRGRPVDFHPRSLTLERPLELLWELPSVARGWMLKENGQSKGQGVHLVHNWSAMKMLGHMVAYRALLQQEVRNPLLLQGHKFALRLFVVVTEFWPNRKVFLLKDGLVRWAFQSFSDQDGTGPAKASTVTNCLIQQQLAHGKFNCNRLADGKLDAAEMHLLSGLRRELSRRGHNDTKLWQHIVEAAAVAFGVVPSLPEEEYHISNVLPQKHRGKIPEALQDFEVHKHCLALYGVDFVIDANLKPWLLEVQVGPNMKPTCPQEWPVRMMLFNGTASLAANRSSDHFHQLPISPQMPLDPADAVFFTHHFSPLTM